MKFIECDEKTVRRVQGPTNGSLCFNCNLFSFVRPGAILQNIISLLFSLSMEFFDDVTHYPDMLITLLLQVEIDQRILRGFLTLAFREFSCDGSSKLLLSCST